ncbi:hypothetical protein ACET3Z_005511 [Daucus carota]
MSCHCLQLACLLTALVLLSSSSHGFNRKLMENVQSQDYEPAVVVVSEGGGCDDYGCPKPNTNSKSAMPVAPAPAP